MRLSLHPRTWFLFLSVVCLSPPAYGAIEDQALPEEEPPPPPKPAPQLTKAPELLEFVPAAYPPELAAQGIGGDVVLLIDIDAEGEVSQVSVSSSTHPTLNVPALVAATQFRFSPAEVDGAPSPIRIEYKYVFEPELQEPDVVAGAPEPDPTEAQGDVRLFGRIREAGERSPIAGAVISVNGTPVAESAADGSFEVRGIPSGEIEVTVSSPYHRTYKVAEQLEDETALKANYYLVRTAYNPFETVVRDKVGRREVSKVRLERKELSQTAGTFGDPLRVIENLPGLLRTPGGVGGALLVRGAAPESTAVFVDGVEVPLLYHFLGLTSILNPSFLESIDFFPGGFGARYGRATAGVLDVGTRKLGCDEEARGVANVNLFDTSLYVCVPTGDWQTAAAIRRSYVDAIIRTAIDNFASGEDAGALTVVPVYLDYQAKTGTRFREKDTFEVFAFGSDDRLEAAQSGSSEDVNFNGNFASSFHRVLLRYQLQVDDDISLNSQIAPGVQILRFRGTSDEIDLDNNFQLTIWSVDWREDLRWKVNDNFTVNAGIDWQAGKADLNLRFPIETEVRGFPQEVFDFTDSQELGQDLPQVNHAYYVEAEIDSGIGLKVTPGLRFDVWKFDDTKDVSVLPRVTARWEFLEGRTMKAAYGLYEKLPEPQFLVPDIGNPNLLPERSHQFIAGYEHVFTDLINVDIQGFYNLRRRLVVESDRSTVADGQQIDENFSSEGRGYTMGMELLIRHLAARNKPFYGWIAYTLSKSVRRDRADDLTLDLSNGQTNEELDRELQTYPDDFDQRHILTIVGQFQNLPWDLEVGFRFRLTSGNRFTPLDQSSRVFYDADGNGYRLDPIDVQRNSGRIETFHQLDLRVDKTWVYRLWKLTAYLEILNVYSRRNVETVQYDYRFRNRTNFRLLPILPTIGLKGEF